MENKKILYIWVLLFSVMFSSKILAENVVVYALEAMPYCGVVQGEPSGIAIELLNEATKRGAPNFIFDFHLPWIRAQKKINDAGEDLVAIIPFSRSPIREKTYKWVVELFPTQYRFYSYKKKSINTVEEAKNLRIGVVRGHAIIPILKSLGINNLDENSNDAAANATKLLKKRFDAAADSDLIAKYNWKKIGERINTLKEGIAVGDTIHVYMAANPNFPKDVAQKITDIMNEMKKDGTYQKIIDKWSK